MNLTGITKLMCKRARGRNRLTTGTRSGTFTVPGVTTGPATNVTVNDVVAERYGDNSFARTNVTLNDGSNTFTAIARHDLGRDT